MLDRPRLDVLIEIEHLVVDGLVFDCAVVGFAGVKPLNITFTMARPLPIYPL